MCKEKSAAIKLCGVGDWILYYVFRKLDSDGSIKQLMLPRAKHFYFIQHLKQSTFITRTALAFKTFG